MADVFLSYAHQDIKRAEGLAGLLEDGGLTVWWDRRMVAGDKIHDVIDEQIEKAKAVIVLWSPISVKSDWVRGEAQTAHELGKLVPIKIAKCQLPINYRGIHTPEVYTSRAEHIKLAKILSDKYGTKIEFPVDSSANFLSKLTTQKVAYQKEYSELSNDWSREEWGKTFRLMKKYPLGATWVIGATALFIFIGVALAWWTGPFGPPRHKDDFTTLRSGPGLESLLSSQKSPGKPLRNYDKQWQENWKTLHQSRKSRPGPD